MQFVILTQSQAAALISLAAIVLGLPQNPDVVISRHGRDRLAGFGRTTVYAVARKHPTRDEWAVPVRILRAIWQAYQAGTLPEPMRQRIQSLTAAQRTAIRDAIQAAMELPADWRPASII